jgi:histidinol phosphatase-like PHP family hydrolase
MDLPATKFVIKELLPQGLAIIGGAPKVGKSWLMLDWCVRIAKGETIWKFPTTKGTTLYVSLEDTASRLQERLLSVTDEAPNVFFTTFSFKIGEGLEEQIKSFVADHPGTALIVIDTFQMIRNTGSEVSYASDYNEIEILKKLAEELKITILLVHHLRKQGDSDPFNMLSGTNGLAGGVDTMFVLDKSKRCSTNATLYCSGRDIEDREIELCFDKDNCVWNFVSDSSYNPGMLLPDEMQKLIEMMKEISFFSGSNANFTERYNQYTGREIKANSLKRMMNRYRSELEDNDIYFESSKRNNVRVIDIYYEPHTDDS